MAKNFFLPLLTDPNYEMGREELNVIIRLISLSLSVGDYKGVLDTIGGWGTGWSDGTVEVGFYRDPFGRVHLRGNPAKGSPSMPDTIFVLDVGYRPLEDMVYWLSDHVLKVTTGGAVILVSAGTYGTETNLTGISFLAEA